MDAANFNLAAFKGKVVYLDFWASWCGPCKLSFPYMASLEQSYPSKDFVVVTVNLDHSRKKADAFLHDVGVQIPVIFDEKGKLATKFHVEQMPTSILFDRTGKLRYVHKGFYQDKEDDYSDHVYQLVNENQK
jgi:thiol-disulfide isomerase/thioredoxin